MALSEEGGGMGTTMLVSPSNVGGGMPYPVPMYGQGGGNGGLNDGSGWWIILLFILIAAMGGNWGGNNNGGGVMGAGTPIVINDGNGGSVQRGFDQAAVMGGLNGIQSGIYNLSTQLCNCCGDMQMSLANGVNSLAQQMYGNTISDLERSFANQTAITQGLNGIQSQLAQCCCDNRMATESLRSTILSENCADRAAISDGIRDLLTAQTAGFQSIKDLLYQDRLDEKNDKISSLERQLTAAQLNASQIAQTGQIVDQVYNRLATCPVGTTPVYGETQIFRCNNNNCGCGGFAA
ncbi:MAG: hypothetical protein J6Y48_03640 [Clostridia bacterium]|nr:hypothetical protein [Clostridia bacterium]